MQKSVIFLALAYLLIISHVFATSPAIEPRCHIEGIIQSVKFKAAYNESCCIYNCLPGQIPCPTDGEFIHPDRYYLNILIEKTSYLDGDTSFSTCESLFPVNQEKTFYIDKSKMNPGDIFIENQHIEGQTPPFGLSYLESYSLNSNSNSNTMAYIIIIAAVILAFLITYLILKNKKRISSSK